MTATVVIFPTPSDLWNTVFPDRQTEEARLVTGGVSRQPLDITSESTEADVLDSLNRCTHAFTTGYNLPKGKCFSILDKAALFLDENPSERVEQELILADTAMCRYVWVGDRDTQRARECQSRLPILADRR